MNEKLRAVVVGCRMGKNHALAMAALDEYQLVALCDLVEETAREVAAETGNPHIYGDYARMLEEVKPDVVVIATPNTTHAPFTRLAVEHGVKAIYCEKPIATNYGDALDMVKLCREKGVALIVGHQRRMSPEYRTMRRLIEEGAIGDVYLMRGSCAGDILSDGTHTIDSLLYLSGDAPIKWILGQVHRPKSELTGESNAANHFAYTGYRYGHVVECGGAASFENDQGVRFEMLTGDLRFPGRGYQDIEIFGTKGRLWRAGDAANPPLVITDEAGGGWRSVAIDDSVPRSDRFHHVFSTFADYIHHRSESHPLSGDNALRSFEVVMGIYESARLHAKLELPLTQKKFPLELMAEDHN